MQRLLQSLTTTRQFTFQFALPMQHLEYEQRIAYLERIILLINEQARTELTLESFKIAMMEASKEELEKELEISQLRLEVQELKFQAQLLQKDRQIEELELKLKSCRSGGMNAQGPP
ncbi:hypothetical protein AC1031_006438 [Aphanomyces cochlioides]|nr:hypothetical protein AC1031_006438 [Aphanomyces cochlioides]